MAKLTTKGRKKLPASSFGLPEERKYPMEDAAHAIRAKGRATQQYAKGNLPLAKLKTITAKANKELEK